LCICSEADAFVAASLPVAPTAKMAFLVLGPMLDLKLYLMYTRVFRPRLMGIIILTVVGLVFCFSVATHYTLEAAAQMDDVFSKSTIETFKSLTTTPRASEVPDKQLVDVDETIKADMALMASGPSPVGDLLRSGAGIMSAALASKGGKPVEMSFKSLEGLAEDAEDRREWKGRNVKVKGQFKPYPDNEYMFSLVRFKIQCCAADVIPLRMPIICNETVEGYEENRWVEVIGKVDFWQSPDKQRWVTVLRVGKRGDINDKIPPDANPYVQ
jgi:hypothetical protein